MRPLAIALFLATAVASALAADAPTQTAIRAARDKVFPALVHLQCVTYTFQAGQRVQQVSVGSGVIIDKLGHVATNYHVAARAEKILCTLSDKTQVPASLVGGDPWTDLAVVLIDKKELKDKAIPFAEFGASSDAQAGDYVLAMGSPLSLSRSISLGIVSCADRYLPAGTKLPTGEPTGLFNTWIQTDAAINPGNSGGPLVSLDGKIVGINTRGVQLAANIGFAIPVDVVKEVTAQLIKRGKVQRGWLGATFQPLRGVEGAAERDEKEGVVVGGVEDNSPAAEAGLRPGDILLKYDGAPVTALFLEDIPAVYRAIAATKLGKTVELTIKRADQVLTFPAKIVALGETRAAEKQIADLGLVVRDITADDLRTRNLPDRVGALIESVAAGGLAAAAGLQAADVILEIDHKPLKSSAELLSAYSALPADKKARFLVKYGRGISVNLALIRKGT